MQGKILVRTNHAEYLATADRPASVHDDLMYLYPDPADQRLRAIYFDTEGHVIHYRVEWPTSDTIQLLSNAAPASPGFRLTYTQIDHDTLHLTFEIAPPGQPDAFSAYLEANLRRSQSD